MSIQKNLSQSASLLGAVDALRNWRAAALMLGTLTATVLLFALGGIVASSLHGLLGFLFGLLALIVVFYGANAVGIMLMDEASGNESRPVLAAVLTSLSTGHRLILLMLLVGAGYLVGLLVMMLVLLLCKLPVLGPVMFAFVFPLFVVVSGIAIFSFYAVITPLAAPAVWSGATTMQGLSRLAAIVRQRIVIVVLSMTVLFLITAVVAAIIGGVMLAGTLVTGGISASVIGVGGMNIARMMNGGGMGAFGGEFGGGGTGHLMAGMIGGAIVWAVAFTLPALVYCRGCCQVYLANIDGVDVAGMEQRLRGSLDAAKRRAEEIKAKGEAMARTPPSPRIEPVAGVMSTVHAATPGVASPSQYRCVSCQTPYSSGDLFCGGCGQKLV